MEVNLESNIEKCTWIAQVILNIGLSVADASIIEI